VPAQSWGEEVRDPGPSVKRLLSKAVSSHRFGS
jgi:hypothetical protein